MPASPAASARLMPSSTFAIASIRSAARRFGSCRARQPSTSRAKSSRIAKAAPIVSSRSPPCEAANHAKSVPKSQFIRSAA